MAAAGTPYENIFRQQDRGASSATQPILQCRPDVGVPPPMYHNVDGMGLTPVHIGSSRPDRASPPTYEEAIDPDAPPPSYDSLFGRVREAHNTSKGVFDFLKNVVILLLGTIGCSIILGVTIVIPICMVVIASMYWNECPKCEYIPVYLLVGGLFGVLKQLLHLSAKVRQREEDVELERIRQSPTQTLINCFMFGWFIIGSVWVYRLYEPNYDPSQGDYCNRTLYLFAFWLLTSVYMMMAVVMVGLCTVSTLSLFSLPCDQPGLVHRSHGRPPLQANRVTVALVQTPFGV